MAKIPSPEKITELKNITRKLSKQVIEMTTKAGSGHPSSSLSMIEILVTLYLGGVMNYRPDQPDWPERDRFILSKGHGVPGLYAVLAEAGYFDPDMLMTLREIGSPLEGHPNMRVLPGIEASTGSLGQGLSIGLGHALAARVDERDYQVYVMIGDGEADEGQIWEAAMAAAKYKVGNLTAILDYNKFQQTGSVRDVMPTLEPLVEKWMAFGWHVTEINGHDFADVFTAFEMDQKLGEKPHIIIAHTLKGHGLSAFEENEVNRMHGKPLSESQKDQALEEISENYYKENLSSVALRPDPESQTLQREA